MAAETPLVAVAANLSPALTEIADDYRIKTGARIKLSFGSSGNFYRQILQGARYHLFLSADKKFLDMLASDGRKISRSTAYARGRIGFFIPNGSRLSGVRDVRGVITAIEFDNYRRMVIANPEVAPYGAAAEQALGSAGVWVINRSKLLLGENASPAVQFSLAGGADIGVIPSSAAVQPEVSKRGKFIPIPEEWHKPILQYLVLLSATSQPAIRFYDYLLSEEAQRTLEKYGYTPVQDLHEP
jgi:molybdate transport system substrate-binding protein